MSWLSPVEVDALRDVQRRELFVQRLRRAQQARSDRLREATPEAKARRRAERTERKRVKARRKRGRR